MAGELRAKTRFSASSPAQSAIGRGVGFWKFLAWTAGALYMVAPLELVSSSVAPSCFLAADSNGPGSFVESEVNGASAHHDGSATNDEEAGKLFGMKTEPVTDGALLDKWRRAGSRALKGCGKDRRVEEPPANRRSCCRGSPGR
jgi:hypothetical protein